MSDHYAYIAAQAISLQGWELGHLTNYHPGKSRDDVGMRVAAAINMAIKDEETARDSVMILAGALQIAVGHLIRCMDDEEARVSLLEQFAEDQRTPDGKNMTLHASDGWIEGFLLNTWNAVAAQKFAGDPPPPEDFPAEYSEYIEQRITDHFAGQVKNIIEEGSIE